MVRMTAPNGATVGVSDEKAERLAGQGYSPVGEPKGASAKRAAPKKSNK